MKNYLAIAGAIILTLMSIAIVVFKPSIASQVVKSDTQSQPTVKVTNETSSLEVVSTEILDNKIIVKIRNSGDRPVFYYQIQYNNRRSVVRIGAGKGFNDAWQPGEIFQTTVPF